MTLADEPCRPIPWHLLSLAFLFLSSLQYLLYLLYLIAQIDIIAK